MWELDTGGQPRGRATGSGGNDAVLGIRWRVAVVITDLGVICVGSAFMRNRLKPASAGIGTALVCRGPGSAGFRKVAKWRKEGPPQSAAGPVVREWRALSAAREAAVLPKARLMQQVPNGFQCRMRMQLKDRRRVREARDDALSPPIQDLQGIGCPS